MTSQSCTPNDMATWQSEFPNPLPAIVIVESTGPLQITTTSEAQYVALYTVKRFITFICVSDSLYMYLRGGSD